MKNNNVLSIREQKIPRTLTWALSLGLLIYFSLFTNLNAQGFGKRGTIGRVIVKNPIVTVIRNNKTLAVSSFGRNLQMGDTVITRAGGKAHIVLNSGNELFLAPDASLKISEELLGNSKKGIKQFILSIYGKIRLQIKKTKAQQTLVRTKTAVIGVKGTDFIVSYENQVTSVATFEGLVNMVSITNQYQIDIPPGKMSSVSPAGDVAPLSEIAGEIMKGLEFAGERLSDFDISGKRIKN